MNFPAVANLSPELKKRISTAVIGVSAIVILLLALGRLGAAILAAVVALGMVYEFATMTFSLADRFEKRLALVGTTWLVAFFNFWVPRGEFELLLLGFVGIFAYFLFTAGRHTDDAFTTHFQELMYAIFGLLYLGFLPLFLPLLYREGAVGSRWIFLFLFIIWAVDVGAYFAGRKYGKRKLYPIISPKKTFEGVYGGILLGIVVTLLFKITVFRSLPWSAVVILPILLGWVSQFGDLCESFLKRAFHAKDSGSILPGHGGFLDRFDGVIFALPVMYACTRIFA